MKYILPSIGRSGGDLLFYLVLRATGGKGVFVSSYSNLNRPDEHVIKTHLPFKKEFNYNYRAIFIYRQTAGIIASLYRIYGDSGFEKRWNEQIRTSFKGKISPLFWKSWMRQHFFHLGIKSRYINFFFAIARYSKLLAFLFLVTGDKFNFKSNIKSWKQSQKTLFVRYEDLGAKKDETLKKMSNWLGVNLPDFEFKKSASRKAELPFILRIAINVTYGFQ